MERTIGIIGYGTMGSWHAQNINARIHGLKAVAVYDIDPARGAKAQEDGLVAYDSAEELLASGIDLVVVATPNHYHSYYSKLAMRSGVNVICEKPACLSCEELDEVIAVSRETGKLFTVHQNRRFDIDYAIADEIIKQGMVGTLSCVESRLFSNRGCSNAWRSSYVAGGGALYDWGIHMIDQVLRLIPSKPTYVFAHLQHLRYDEVDDGGHLTIGFENGCCARIVFDFWCYINEPRWRISGTDGTAQIDKWFEKEGKVVKANINEVTVEQGIVYTPNGLSRTMWPRPKQEIQELPLPLPVEEPRWEAYYENILDVLNNGAAPLVTHDHVRASTQVMMAAFESHKTKQTVFL